MHSTKNVILPSGRKLFLDESVMIWLGEMCLNSKSRTKHANTELSFKNLQKMMVMCSQQTYLVNLLKRYSPKCYFGWKNM